MEEKPKLTVEIDSDDDIESDIVITQGGAVVATVLGSDQFPCFDGDAILFRREQEALAHLMASSDKLETEIKRLRKANEILISACEDAIGQVDQGVEAVLREAIKTARGS